MLYTLVIVPPDPIYTQLKDMIRELAKKFRGPVFEPHLTILSKIERELPEIETAVKEIATNLKPFELTLGPVSFSTTFYQSVFVRVNSTAKLMDINLEAKKLLKMDNDVFMPHISLLYGEHSMAIREEAVSKIHLPSVTFTVSEFTIVPRIVDPLVWRVDAQIPFGKK